MVVGLRWREQAQLEQLLRGLSDPDSPHYRKYLTAEEFHARFAPTDQTIEAARLLLRDHGLGVVEVSPSGLFISATGWVTDIGAAGTEVLTALRALTNEVRLYFYVNAPGALGKAEGGSASGDGAIEMRPPIQEVTLLPRALQAAFTPSTIAQAYGFDGLYTRRVNAGPRRNGTIAIATAYGFNRADLKAFWAQNGIARSDHDVELTWVGDASDVDHIESTVDVQWASSLAPTSPLIVYAANAPSGHNFLKVFDRIITENRAGVLVTSWGACENQLSMTYLEQVHIAFQRAAAQGITVIAASGDRGSDDCGNGGMSVDFPASDPNVLAVGGTTLRNDGAYAKERAWDGSGGGTSFLWPAPPWQMHPNRNRVLADVAFHADPSPGFSSRFEGRAVVVGGTSLAAPAWAALLALANDARGSSGGDTLGVAAPALCEVALAQNLSPGAFRDVLSGDNGGYSAAQGWDFPTGWGSPRAASLVDALSQSTPRLLSTGQTERGILLTPTRDDVGGLRAQLFHQCARTALRLEGRGLAPGDYVVFFDAEPVASFSVRATGRLSVTLRGLDPRGVAITVSRADRDMVFGGQFPAKLEPSTRVEVELDSTGVIAEASGVAQYQRRHGRERFTVRVQDVSPSVYDLRLGNSVVASFTVPAGRSTGRVSFNVLGAMGSYRPNNPLCDSISILRSGVTVLRAGRSASSRDLCPEEP